MDCRFGDVIDNCNRAVELIRSVDADLFVLPELFNSGYLFISSQEVEAVAEQLPGGNTEQTLTSLAIEKKCYIVAGCAEDDAGAIYNSSFLTGPEGYIGKYRKIHLFNEEKKWFKPGDLPFPVYDIGSGKIGMMICFDWIFPESVRTLALKGADIICHCTNLVLPYCQNAMVTRCLENRVFAVTANRIGFEQRGNKSFTYTGMSQITGPNGEIIHRAPADVEQVHVVEIDPTLSRDKNITPFNDLFTDRRPDMYA